MSEDNSVMDERTLLDTVLAAVRAPKRGDLESLLASNLAHATFAKPLDKIRLVLETFMLLPAEEQEKITSQEERSRIERLYKVAVSLSTVISYPAPRGEIEAYGSVAWAFPPEQAPEHLDFINNVYRVAEDVDELTGEGKGSTGWRRYLTILYYAFTRNLCSLLFIKMVESEFIVSAMPFTLELSRRIFRHYVSRETWAETLMALHGARIRTVREDAP
jgi:hypothetical protein